MGVVSSITLTDSGFGYTTAPTITLTAPTADSSNAAAIATADSYGKISLITLTDSGQYYTFAPTVTIALPEQDSVNGVFSLTIDSSGSISSISVTNVGALYTSAPIISIGAPDSAGGVQATAVCTVTDGTIDSSVTITDSGSGYNTAPTITVGAPTGTVSDFRATATATVDSAQGGTLSLSIVDSGAFYSFGSHSITIDSAQGTAEDYRARATVAIDDSGRVRSYNITYAGGGYLTAPTVAISEAPALNIAQNDLAQQLLGSGATIKGEIAKYSDSDGVFHLIHVGADDGTYHEFVSGRAMQITTATETINRMVTSIPGQENKISENEQNDYFSSVGADFLDFSEANPFGDPENN